MPRPETVQPEPLDRFRFGDTEVLMIDESTWPIGRGEHKRMAFDAKACDILQLVLEDYTVPDPEFSKDSGRRVFELLKGDRDYMANASKFARRIEMSDKVECGIDDSSLRKKIYPYVSLALTVMVNAVKNRDSQTA